MDSVGKPKLLILSGNQLKIEEIVKFFSLHPAVDTGTIMGLDIDEVQSLNYLEIITKKLHAYAKKLNLSNIRIVDHIIADEIAIELGCLNGLPGPLVKYFEERLSEQEYYNLCSKQGDFSATVVHNLGYLRSEIDGATKIEIFRHEIKGTIVEPREGFGKVFYQVFQENETMTFSQMNTEYRNNISPRGKNLQKLVDFLTKYKLS